MARLAFMSPWPPQASGIATCAADLVPLLAGAGHAIDVFVDEARLPVDRGPDGPPAPGQVRVLGAHEFLWRQARGQYDLPVYQVGNSRLHGYIWPYLFRAPGLSVLHDASLHHARADALLSRRRHADYRAEFTYNAPGVSADAAELAVAGFDGAYYYEWPMRRAVVDASRVVAVHSAGMAADLQAAHPDRLITHIPLGHGRDRSGADLAAGRAAFRAAAGIPADALLFGVLGGIAAEKRIAPIVGAFAAARRWAPDARLLLAGAVDPLLPLSDLLDAAGITGVTHLTGRLDDAAFDDAVAACDVGLHLRWPTAREVSGPWLRMIAAGRPTVVIDTAHQADLPALDPRTWRPHAGHPAGSPNDALEPVTIALDILDEDHSLRLALRRLASDPDLRQRLGTAARQHWLTHHTVEGMAGGYARAIAQALAVDPPIASLPPHLRPDPQAHLDRLLDGIGITGFTWR